MYAHEKIKTGKKYTPILNLVWQRISSDNDYMNLVIDVRKKIMMGEHVYKHDIEGIFGPGYPTLPDVFGIFINAEIKRQCENFYASHLLDGCIISHVLGMPSGDNGGSARQRTRTYGWHDFLEIFALKKESKESFKTQYEKTLARVPKDIQTNVNLITNKWRLIASYIKQRSDKEGKTLTSEHANRYLDEIAKEAKEPKLFETTTKMYDLLREYDEKKNDYGGDIFDFIVDHSYKYYMDEMIEFLVFEYQRIPIVQGSKIIDGADNTYTDTPLGLADTLKRYNRNKLVLEGDVRLKELGKMDPDTNLLHYFLEESIFSKLKKKTNNLKHDMEGDPFWSLRLENQMKILDNLIGELVSTYYRDWKKFNSQIKQYIPKKGSISDRDWSSILKHASALML